MIFRTCGTDLLSDVHGKGAVRFALGSCMLAIAVASASPRFEANPMIGDKLVAMREHLPVALDRIREAMDH